MQDQINRLLQDAYLDQRLDVDEKHALYQLLLTLKTHEKRYLRNQAFDIVRRELEEGENGEQALRWLQKVAKVIDKSYDQSVIATSAYFSPGTSCRDAIISLLNGARSRIDICVFTISDNNITEAIHRAHQRKLDVRIVTDNDKANDRGSDVYQLMEAGIPTCMDSSPNHMHHKFALIDEQLINGSFNWTRSATKYNQENIVISDNKDIVTQFESVFADLWQKFGRSN